MTTIAARAGVLASDSLETATENETGDLGYVVTDKSTKIWRLPTGELFGAAHNSEDTIRLYRAMCGNGAELNSAELPDFDCVCGLIVKLDKTIWVCEGRIWVEITEPYAAIGSGARFALAAFRAGADAVTAAKIGADMDPYSGGEVQVLRLK